MGTTDKVTPAEETFSIVDQFLPGAKAGLHTLYVEQVVKLNAKANDPRSWKESAELTFEITAPRFRLATPSDEIHSMFPPQGATADYGKLLPYLVLRRRSLPWERPLEPAAGEAADRDRPWMALIVLGANDLAEGAVSFQTLTVGELASTNCYSPFGDPKLKEKLNLHAEDKAEKVSVLELSADRLRLLCPQPEELRALVHMRRVPLGDKQDNDPRKQADFAVLLANRLPQPGLNQVLLVSLEGWESWLKGKADAYPQEKVRLLVLHSWQFTSALGRGLFVQRVEDIGVGPLVDLDSIDKMKNPAAKRCLEAGRTPVAWRPDGAEQTYAWYGGPLSPMAVQPFPGDSTTFERADSALVFDPATGVMDISYSAAWQLGRLLAVSSAAFGAAVRRWNHAKQLDEMRSVTGAASAERTSLAVDMTRYLESHSDLYARKNPPAHERPEEDRSVVGAASAGSASFKNEAASASDRDSDRDASKDPLFDDVQAVTSWLGDLLLLRPVPLQYLIPSGRMLPVESLRVFHVDTRWLDALTDGALSVSAHSPSARSFVHADRALLRRAIRRMMARKRREARGEVIETERENQPLRGFLLRSRLLEEFPGVEVELRGDDDRRLDVLRMEKIAGDVLLVLLQGAAAKIVFKEPREGLRFGLATDGRLHPRKTDTSAPAEIGRSAGTARVVPMRTGIPGVIQVGELARTLEPQDPTSGARYALHWLRAPEDVVIEWRHTG